MRLLTKKEVRARVCYSYAHIDRMEAEGRFPLRVRLGQCRVAWVEDEITAWILERIAERDRSGK
jgi:prophage regulatory protein